MLGKAPFAVYFYHLLVCIMRFCRYNFLVVFALLLLIWHSMPAYAQLPVRGLLDSLAAPAMAGRGYVDNGLRQAAYFIEQSFAAAGLQSVQGSYRQPFRHAVNTFPGAMSFSLAQKKLQPGKDFLVYPSSRGIAASDRLTPMDSLRWLDASRRVVVEKVKKLTWGVSTWQDDYTLVQVLDQAFPAEGVLSYESRIEAIFLPVYEAHNIMAMVPGTRQPDSLLVVTAHYDHLGIMGKLPDGSPAAVFSGANDNASGVALMLALARHIARHPLPYSVLFIAFAGEETGLLGSAHFVNNSPLPLSRMRFVINLDMVGTGNDGIMVVNATEHVAEYQLLDSLNRQHGWLPQVAQRGKARNSDHHSFTEAGVPSFFIYTLGGTAAYHDVQDVPDQLPLTKTQELGALLLSFMQALASGIHFQIGPTTR